MKLNVSKEWCMKMAQLEGNKAIGCGGGAVSDELRLLLTTARVLRALMFDAIAHHPDDMIAMNEALAPFEAALGEPVNEQSS